MVNYYLCYRCSGHSLVTVNQMPLEEGHQGRQRKDTDRPRILFEATGLAAPLTDPIHRGLFTIYLVLR